MISLRQSTNIALYILVICTLLPTGNPQAEQSTDKVLIIRADKIAETAISQEIAVSPRDPFNWPPEQINKFNYLEKKQKEDPFSGLKLLGIIWNKEKPLAIINDNLVSQGDTIKDVYIREISPQQVMLESMGRYHTLELSTKIINLGSIKE
ncbi:MAG: hypothetical protein KKB30_15155 [Proteobacteria bacterium]|nr:hypothetical protein [Pseudomonadota bacterium]MBU1716262.1 hypothetical protein [Pseudomonadota bacterium]